MTGHTPGPWLWHWRDDEDAPGSVFAMPRPGHAYAVAMCPRYGKDSWEQDARLIAAAPELLEALKAMIEGNYTYNEDLQAKVCQPNERGRWDSRQMPSDEACTKAAAAIAKATGETE